MSSRYRGVPCPRRRPQDGPAGVPPALRPPVDGVRGTPGRSGPVGLGVLQQGLMGELVASLLRPGRRPAAGCGRRRSVNQPARSRRRYSPLRAGGRRRGASDGMPDRSPAPAVRQRRPAASMPKHVRTATARRRRGGSGRRSPGGPAPPAPARPRTALSAPAASQPADAQAGRSAGSSVMGRLLTST